MRKLIAAAATLASLAVTPLAFSVDAPAVEPPTFRLPTSARPLRYSVALTLVPGEARAAGEIAFEECPLPRSIEAGSTNSSS